MSMGAHDMKGSSETEAAAHDEQTVAEAAAAEQAEHEAGAVLEEAGEEERIAPDVDEPGAGQTTGVSNEQEAGASASELADAIAARDELRDQLLRTRAEFDNYRKRVAREQEQAFRRAAADVIGELLPIHDNLNLAIEHSAGDPEGLREGVQMVAKQFESVLSKQGVTPIAAANAPFDPELHEAMMQSPSETVPEGHIVQELQQGYTLGGQVLRHARVIVSAGPPAGTGETNPQD